MSYENARKYSFSHELVGLKMIVSSFCLRFLLYLFSFNVDLNISHGACLFLMWFCCPKTIYIVLAVCLILPFCIV